MQCGGSVMGLLAMFWERAKVQGDFIPIIINYYITIRVYT